MAPRVRADAPTIGVRYRAPSACPTEVEFFTEVRRRNPRVEAAAATAAAQLVVMIAEGSAQRYVGRLERVTPRGDVGVREIAGDSCRDVAQALALITALTADLVSAPGAAAEPERTVPPRANVDATEHALPLDDTTVAAPIADAHGVPRGRWQIGLDGLVASGVTPNPLAGVTLFAELDGRSSAFWVPGVRLSTSFGASSWSSDAGDGAEGRFEWMVASLDGCPFQIGDPLDLVARACARVTGGLLRAAGAGRATPYVEYPLWGDAGAVARVHWLVRRALFLEVEGEAFVPATHLVFDFRFPSKTAIVAGSVGYRFGAGFSVVFR